ncbi:MAG: hypothetical protein N3D82_04340 [Ignisphaera sp.]|nr:hypothetical protein [Ignisphaera sp.]MCX8168237.1 hypothetical protein [Ignisphaera sp.]MDW8084895.1 hypothetical protein [Ignisphaera sp.]
MNSALFRVLHELVDILEVFTRGMNEYRKMVGYLNPLTVFTIFVSMAVIAAYSSSDAVRIVVLSICMAQLSLMGSRKTVAGIIKTYGFIIILAAFLGLPSIYIYMEKHNIIESVARTIFISISSSTPVAVLSILVGIKGVGEILLIFSKTIGRAVSAFSTIFLKISRLQVDILLMRFSRNISSGRRNIWRVMVSSLGDALLHSEYISQNIALVIKSRTLAEKSLKNSYGLRLPDYIIIFASVLISSISIAVWR